MESIINEQNMFKETYGNAFFDQTMPGIAIEKQKIGSGSGFFTGKKIYGFWLFRLRSLYPVIKIKSEFSFVLVSEPNTEKGQD